MTMLQPTTDAPIEAVYPIEEQGPDVMRLNAYSALYRVAIAPPPPPPPIAAEPPPHD